MPTKTKSVTISDKVLLEKIIEEHLMNDIPLSLLLEKYDLTYPQIQLLMNKIRGFSRQSEMLSEANDLFSYDDLPEEYLVIPHTFPEKSPFKHEEIMAKFARLAELKKELSKTPEISLNEYKEKVSSLKSKVNSYDETTIGNIESFMRDYDELVTKGITIDEITLLRILSKNHIGVSDSQSLNELYSNYLSDKETLLQAEKELEIKKVENKERSKLEREYESIREDLVVHNVKLVNWCIRKFFNNIALSKEEAQAYGLEGLVKAINDFDYTKGFHFSTFAVVVIVRHIERHFEDIYGMSWRDFVNKNAIKYYRRLMREENPDRVADATPQELSDMGLLPLTATKIANYDKLAYPAQPISNVYNEFDDGYKQTRSTEMPTTMEDYEAIDAYLDKITPIGEEDVSEKIINNLLTEDLKTSMDSLTEREQDVLNMRYGFYDGKMHSYDEIGAVFGVTRERIRQIENKAIRKMRHPSRAKHIRAYYTDEDYSTGYGSSYKNELSNDKIYGKLRYLLSLDISKNGMLTFMNMEGLNWTEEKLEQAITTLTVISDIVIDCALEGKTISEIRNKIYDSLNLVFSSKFIEDVVERVKDRLNPEIVEQLLPQKEDEPKKM